MVVLAPSGHPAAASARQAASSSNATLSLAYVGDGARPEHRRGLRRPPRPRLRGLLRDRRLTGAGSGRASSSKAGERRGLHAPRRRAAPRTCPGIHLNFLLILVFAVDHHDDRRDADRVADPAPARRLHRDRHARLRRDHRPHRHQRRRASTTSPGDDSSPTGRQGSHAGGQRMPIDLIHSGSSRSKRSTSDRGTCGARDGAPRPVRELPAARLAARASLDRAARGRGGGRLHGRAARADQAARLRHRRRVRRYPGASSASYLNTVNADQFEFSFSIFVLAMVDPRRPRVDRGRGARRDRARPTSTTT